jgi:selenide,water dikinase
MPRALLRDVLSTIRSTGLSHVDADLLIGFDMPDDAAVCAIDTDRARIVTSDFLTPIVDDPCEWRRIAATNVLSDVHGMGGRPLLALSLLAWPATFPDQTLAAVLRGGTRAVSDSGALLVGGHSIVDPMPIYGLVAVDEIDPRRMLTKCGGRAGDLLVLTKPLGGGVVETAVKRGEAPAALIDAVAR